MKVYVRKALCICLIFLMILESLSSFVNLVLIFHLPLYLDGKKSQVICLHINDNYNTHKQFPLLPTSIDILLKNNKEVYNVFIGDIQFCAKHEHKWETSLGSVGNQSIMHFLIVQKTVSYYGWNIGYSIEF